MRLREDDLLSEDEEIGDGSGYAAECIREPHSDNEDADYITQSTTGIGSTSYDCPDSDRDTPTLAYSDNESDTPTPANCSKSERATSI
ncbi:unnamed protein product [Parnassius apollo]|uniref:(apollo) hypothetical protein n=1 Tax=Parnassius apollo TaxID=110799 RepID=A0A8S3WT09_PARAO|nr:unnamed protein product [Parnassius apollo]